MNKSKLILTIIKIPLDFVMIILAGITAYSLRFLPIFTSIKPIYFTFTLREYLLLLLMGACFTIVIFAFAGLYQTKHFKSIEEIFHIIVATAGSLLVINFSAYLSQVFFESRFILIFTWALSAIFVILGRNILKLIQHILIKYYQIGLHKMIVIGESNATQEISAYLKKKPALGYKIVKKFKKIDFQKLEKTLEKYQVDSILLGNSHPTKEQIMDLFNLCSQKSVDFRFIPTNFQALTAGLTMETLGGFPLLEAKRTPIEGWRRITKRIFDLIFGTIFLIFLSPIFTITAFLIKWDSKGPIFAKMPHRVGKGERVFFMYKFRSMIPGAQHMKKELMKLNEREYGKGPLFKLKQDPRITKIGKILRKYRIDEFPQLINVFKGDMSLVGPRAHEIEEVKKYKGNHKAVFAIKPGITGLAQISGSSDLPFGEENKLDLYYIEHWSLWLDIKILIKTFFFMFTDRSAC
jgi:exopolysaccharide biosynthesis polyprenyl glycosylphosphotransferase